MLSLHPKLEVRQTWKYEVIDYNRSLRALLRTRNHFLDRKKGKILSYFHFLLDIRICYHNRESLWDLFHRFLKISKFDENCL